MEFFQNIAKEIEDLFLSKEKQERTMEAATNIGFYYKLDEFTVDLSKPIENFLVPVIGALFNKTDVETVKELDSNKYIGTWYEYSKFPNSFERGQTDIKARYYSDENGTLKVENSSLTENGNSKNIVGNLYLNKKEPGKLSVEFFKPFKGDYWVVHLADDYSYSVVTNPFKTLLWVLVRDLNFFKENPLEYEKIIEFLKSNNYNIDNLERTIHNDLTC